ncbi:coiled-coil domain-containing protein 113-like [Plakobranchus ocellatus]|uniref:Coiled-coil domain-containing protein 113-like n=1 Tax=Plakobranchus ocellatus TaxID=259542 RepID=A0AAV4AID3_9GAST|nr:coiled-coil domain-containing protein 113-like [Plakobranchus ocellatus]
MLFIEGIPLLYLELAIGQRLRMGCVSVWNQVHPLIGGIGLASAVTSFMVAIYYNAIIMWCFFYLFHSFQSPLPWASCPTYTNEENETLLVHECDVSDPTSYFWYRKALDISPGIDESGGVQWKMLGCHAFAWIVIYLCVYKGIKSSGKVVYVTATFPYVVLTIFFIRGITLDGSIDGLKHMFTPKIELLLDMQCWLDAAAQIFFSFGLGFGGLIAFSSYNPMHNNVRQDALVVGVTNWFTAIYACAVVFAVIGFKATVMYKHCLDHNIDIVGDICSRPEFVDTLCHGHNSSATITHDIYKTTFKDQIPVLQNLTDEEFRECSLEEDLNKGVEGTGLAFIIFTQAINEFGPSAPFWSVVFFLMLLSLGLGSEFGTIEGVTTSLYDLEPFPWVRKKWLTSGILCLLCFFIGLLFVLGSGSYWVALFDTFAGSFPLIIVALGECLAVGWVFGVNRFANEIQYMIGSRPGLYWKIAWKYIAPATIMSLLMGTLILQFSKPITYSAYDKETGLMDDVPYPWYASVICAFLVLSSVLWIPGIALARKTGLLYYDRAKVLAAEMHRATESTTKFLGSQLSSRSEDRDSGRDSEGDESPQTEARESEKPTKFGLNDIIASPDGATSSLV